MTKYNHGIVGILSYYSLTKSNNIVAIFVKVRSFFTWLEEAKMHSVQKSNRSDYKIIRYDDKYKRFDRDSESHIYDSSVPSKKVKH